MCGCLGLRRRRAAEHPPAALGTGGKTEAQHERDKNAEVHDVRDGTNISRGQEVAVPFSADAAAALANGSIRQVKARAEEETWVGVQTQSGTVFDEVGRLYSLHGSAPWQSGKAGR